MKRIFTCAAVCCFVFQINGMVKSQQLTPEQIEQKRKYYCTSLVELCYLKMVYNYKEFLRHKGDDEAVTHDIKEGVIKRLLYPEVLSVLACKKNTFFSEYIAAYKKMNSFYSSSIVLPAERYTGKLLKLKKIVEALYEREPDLMYKGQVNYLKNNVGGNTSLHTFDTGEVVLNLNNSHVYLFDKNYFLTYAVGSVSTALTTVKCEHVGQRKCIFIGDKSGKIHIATTEDGGFTSGQLPGSVIDFKIISGLEDRIAVHYQEGQDKKVALLRANETYFNHWFWKSTIHYVEEGKIEEVKFSKKNGQLVTYSPKGKKRWDFLYDDNGSKVLQEIIKEADMH